MISEPDLAGGRPGWRRFSSVLLHQQLQSGQGTSRLILTVIDFGHRQLHRLMPRLVGKGTMVTDQRLVGPTQAVQDVPAKGPPRDEIPVPG